MCYAVYPSCELWPFFPHRCHWDSVEFSALFTCKMALSACNQVKNLHKCTLFTFGLGKASCQSFLYIRFWRAVVGGVAPMVGNVWFHPAEFTFVFRNNNRKVHHVLPDEWDLVQKHFPFLPKAVLIWQIIIYAHYLTFNDLSYDLFMNDTSQQVDITCYSVTTPLVIFQRNTQTFTCCFFEIIQYFLFLW